MARGPLSPAVRGVKAKPAGGQTGIWMVENIQQAHPEAYITYSIMISKVLALGEELGSFVFSNIWKGSEERFQMLGTDAVVI